MLSRFISRHDLRSSWCWRNVSPLGQSVTLARGSSRNCRRVVGVVVGAVMAGRHGGSGRWGGRRFVLARSGVFVRSTPLHPPLRREVFYVDPLPSLGKNFDITKLDLRNNTNPRDLLHPTRSSLPHAIYAIPPTPRDPLRLFAHFALCRARRVFHITPFRLPFSTFPPNPFRSLSG